MAKDKSSFVLYCDIIHTVNKLSDEQAGNLFKHILKYVNDEQPEPENIVTEIAFEPIKQSLKRDLKKYEAICERNKNNGSKGGRPNKKPKKPNGLFGNPSKPKKADSDSDSDSEIEKDNKKEVISSLVEIKERIYNAEFESFLKWLKGKGSNLGKMRDQLSYEEFETLILKYGIQSVRDIFEVMNNKVDLTKKYVSVYSTATNWLNNNLKKTTNGQPNNSNGSIGKGRNGGVSQSYRDKLLSDLHAGINEAASKEASNS